MNKRRYSTKKRTAATSTTQIHAPRDSACSSRVLVLINIAVGVAEWAGRRHEDNQLVPAYN